MRKKTKKIGILALAVLFLIIGLAGLVLPILNGILFLIVSLVLFSVYSVSSKKFLHKIGSQHPKAAKMVTKVEEWVAKRVGEI